MLYVIYTSQKLTPTPTEINFQSLQGPRHLHFGVLFVPQGLGLVSWQWSLAPNGWPNVGNLFSPFAVSSTNKHAKLNEHQHRSWPKASAFRARTPLNSPNASAFRQLFVLQVFGYPFRGQCCAASFFAKILHLSTVPGQIIISKEWSYPSYLSPPPTPGFPRVRESHGELQESKEEGHGQAESKPHRDF